MNPYITFVTAARNDNFGGDFLRRFQASINSIFTLCKKYKLPAEFIIVEWNPPPDRPRLHDALTWPHDTGPVSVRIIEVPHHIHTRYTRSGKIPFFEFFAKNVGIRRAKGEYVLATNSDIIFSDEMVKFLASRTLADNVSFKTDRHDVYPTAKRFGGRVKDVFPFDKPLEEQLAFCRQRTFQVQTMYGALFTSNKEWIKARVVDRIKHITLKKIIKKLKSLVGYQADAEKITYNAGRWQGLHLNVGGDFFMLSKKQWDEFRGYPDLGVDRGLDCYMTIMCHFKGLLQVILPYPIYHLEHDRSAQYLRPTAVLEHIPEFEQMAETGKVIIINGEHWGLGNEDLKETVF